MKMDEPLVLAPPRGDCLRRRLAESEVLTVDVCNCGYFQLHLGAMTLRMTPSAVSEVIETLVRAVDANNQLQGGETQGPRQLPRSRGQA